jgi:carbamate kinase
VKVVIALGGNALAAEGVLERRESIAAAARAISEVASHHDVIVTHGNGPQAGLLSLAAEAVVPGGEPLDVIGAESEGLLGYLIEQELANLLPSRDIATLLTQVEVARDDPAFANPTKPIGPVMDEATARARAAERKWSIGPDRGGWRRLVPSPNPRHILEIRTIELLMRLGILVVCCGGGGIPVVESSDGSHHGVEAVIDKDRSAVLLATMLGAERLLLLTDVPAVFADWPDRSQAIRSASPRSLAGMSFDPGSMGPKVEAACRFVKQTGATAHIGLVRDAARMLKGDAGTTVRAGTDPIEIA